MDQTTPNTPSDHGNHGVHICHRCGWPFPNPHPSSKHRRAHKRVCGTIEGYTKLIDSQAVSDDEHHPVSDSDDADKDKDKTPTPSLEFEKRIIKESGSSAGWTQKISNRSEESDVNTDSGMKTSVPLVEDKDKLIDLVEPSTNTGQTKPEIVEVSENKDQGEEDVYVLSVPSDIPLLHHAETLIKDFKDHKTIYSNSPKGEKDSGNRSMVDTFEVKTAEKNIHDNIYESQISEHAKSSMDSVVYEHQDSNLSTSVPAVSEAAKVAETEPLEMSKSIPESTEKVWKIEVVKKDEINHSVLVLTEAYTQETVREPQSGIEAKQKMEENVGADSKDSGKGGISERLQEFTPEKTEHSQNTTGVVSETLLDEGDAKLMTSQDCGVDASIGSSSRNSLECNWGSVSVLSTASENAHSINKSEIPEDKSRLGRSDDVQGSLVESKEEIVDQKASKLSITLQNPQQPKSEAKVCNETEGRKRNEEAISKVKNWSTSEQTTTPLKKLVKEAKSSNPIQLSTIIQKDEPAEKTNEPENSNMKHETPKINQESSPPKYIGEDKKAETKSKGRTLWVPFACCSSANVN